MEYINPHIQRGKAGPTRDPAPIFLQARVAPDFSSADGERHESIGTIPLHQ